MQNSKGKLDLFKQRTKSAAEPDNNKSQDPSGNDEERGKPARAPSGEDEERGEPARAPSGEDDCGGCCDCGGCGDCGGCCDCGGCGDCGDCKTGEAKGEMKVQENMAGTSADSEPKMSTIPA